MASWMYGGKGTRICVPHEDGGMKCYPCGVNIPIRHTDKSSNVKYDCDSSMKLVHAGNHQFDAYTDGENRGTLRSLSRTHPLGMFHVKSEGGQEISCVVNGKDLICQMNEPQLWVDIPHIQQQQHQSSPVSPTNTRTPSCAFRPVVLPTFADAPQGCGACSQRDSGSAMYMYVPPNFRRFVSGASSNSMSNNSSRGISEEELQMRKINVEEINEQAALLAQML